MRNIETSDTGRVIIFQRKPNGSWLTEGERYLIEAVGRRTVYFRNCETGCGTQDNAAVIRLTAQFTIED